MSRTGQIEFLHLCDSDRVFASSPYLRITTFPQLGMLYLASILRQAGFDVRYRDRAYDPITPATLKEIAGERPLFIGLYSNIALKADVVEAIRQVRSFSVSVPVIVGGPGHFEASEYFEAGATAVVAGMAECIITRIAESIRDAGSLENIPGVLLPGMPPDSTWAPPPEDLDALPFPAWDLAPPGKFRNDLAFIQKNPWYVVLASRGCPFRCSFCSHIYPEGRGKYRVRSAGSVVEEVRQLHQGYRVRHIKFQDDAFGAARPWLAEFCDRMTGEKMPVGWNCSSVPSLFKGYDEAFFKNMRRAGCTGLHFGLQSTSPEILVRVRRNPEEPDILRDIIPAMRRAGLYIIVDLIVGLPGEDAGTIEAHSRYVRRLPVHMVEVFPLQVVPQTALDEEYPDGAITKMSRGELDDGVRGITRSFMVHPVTLWRNLAYILRNNPLFILTLLRLLPYIFRLAFGRYVMAAFRSSVQVKHTEGAGND